MEKLFCSFFTFMIVSVSYSQTDSKVISQYIFPEFTRGEILLQDGNKYAVLLNYNTLTEEMIFENNGKKMAIGEMELDRIDTVYILDRKFFPVKGNFVESVHQSTWELFVQHKSSFKDTGKSIGYGSKTKTLSVKHVTSIYSEANLYDLKLPDSYELDPFICYWLKKSEDLVEFCDLRALKRIYRDKKELYKEYIKNNDVKFDDQDSIIRLIEHLESN